MKGKRGPIYIVAGVGVALIILIVAGLILPKAAAVRSKNQQVEQAQAQMEALVAQLGQLKADQADAGQAHRKLARFNAEIPPTADLPGIIRLINSVADRSGVDFISVSPSQPALSTDSKYSSIPTQLNLTGTYFALDQFLFSLEGLSRIATVGSISMTPTDANGTKLSLTLDASFFTTDLSAGSGSLPGPTKTLPNTTVNPVPSPGSSSSPAANPAPSSTPTGA